MPTIHLNQHIYNTPGVVMEAQGKLLKVKCEVPKQKWERGGIRGVVDAGFSAASRKRLFESLARLDYDRMRRSGPVVFLTLTYGPTFPDAERAKENLQALLERLRRRFVHVSGFWRLEFQKRGAPHFHLLLFGLPFVSKYVVQRWWGEIIGFPEPFTRIEAVRSFKGVMSYASKYVAKRDLPAATEVAGGFGFCSAVGELGESSTWVAKRGGLRVAVVGLRRSVAVGVVGLSIPHISTVGASVGRLWGVFQRSELPQAVKHHAWLNFGRWFASARYFASVEWAGVRSDVGSGFTLFVEDAARWFDFLGQLWADDEGGPCVRGALNAAYSVGA